MFIHHPDGYILIGAERHSLPLTVFQRYEPDYKLPEGYTGRTYEPGVRHFLLKKSGQEPQPLVWAEGDAYLARQSKYVRTAARQQAQQAVRAEESGVPVIQRKVRTYDRQQQKRVLSRIGGSGGRDADRAGKGA